MLIIAEHYEYKQGGSLHLPPSHTCMHAIDWYHNLNRVVKGQTSKHEEVIV